MLSSSRCALPQGIGNPTAGFLGDASIDEAILMPNMPSFVSPEGNGPVRGLDLELEVDHA